MSAVSHRRFDDKPPRCPGRHRACQWKESRRRRSKPRHIFRHFQLVRDRLPDGRCRARRFKIGGGTFADGYATFAGKHSALRGKMNHFARVELK